MVLAAIEPEQVSGRVFPSLIPALTYAVFLLGCSILVLAH
ncbi:hypothetical protein MPLB_2170001 [Mesorhizobium sp. ORS 3324]|nr:hypothetical protein MPLB_2170001 [Mesorhizobium sp. ORS 3324]